ncbi:11040_t:CDS:2, partial [Scutellospora calospora]
HADLKVAVQNVLDESPYHCLVSDGWTNINKSSVINYMITIPAPIFYKSVHTCEEHHMAENIANGINNAAWNILKVKYPDKVFIRCWAHSINLWVKDILKNKWAAYVLKKAKNDEPYLSSAYKNLQKLKNTIVNNLQVPEELQNEALQTTRSRWVNILYNPAVIIAYTLDPKYQNEDLDFRMWRDIINKEVIRIASIDNDNEDQVLNELAEYLRKSGDNQELSNSSDNMLEENNLANFSNNLLNMLDDKALEILQNNIYNENIENIHHNEPPNDTYEDNDDNIFSMSSKETDKVLSRVLYRILAVLCSIENILKFIHISKLPEEDIDTIFVLETIETSLTNARILLLDFLFYINKTRRDNTINCISYEYNSPNKNEFKNYASSRRSNTSNNTRITHSHFNNNASNIFAIPKKSDQRQLVVDLR